jgi:hypothetical protein
MRAGILTVALCLLVTLTGACSDDSSDDGAEDTTTTVPECEADDLDAEELEGAIVAAVPDGYELQPDDVGDTGPSDLAKAIRDDGQDDAEEQLTKLKFRRGYQWLWTNDANEQLLSFVYEFCEAQGATGYARRAEELTEPGATEVVDFEVPMLDDVEAARTGLGEDGQYRFAYVDSIVGRNHVRTMTFGPPTSDPAALQNRVTALAVAQTAALASA